MSSEQLSIVVFGAHPDDCDFRAGGMALKWHALGHKVRFVSMTNGDTGHHSIGGGALAKRRYAETQAAAKIAGIQYDTLDIHNGELEPSVLVRKMVIKIMRESKADLVLCHRANDYHPDHRAVGVVVQDAAYVVTVPNVAPLTPHLEKPPVLVYCWDDFKKPLPFTATVAVDTDDVFEKKVDMAHCHESQVYEWLPYSGGQADEVPEDDAGRRAWLHERLTKRFAHEADDCREKLIEIYGPERGAQIKTCEAIEASEYGRRMTEEDIPRLFPFLPAKSD